MYEKKLMQYCRLGIFFASMNHKNELFIYLCKCIQKGLSATKLNIAKFQNIFSIKHSQSTVYTATSVIHEHIMWKTYSSSFILQGGDTTTHKTGGHNTDIVYTHIHSLSLSLSLSLSQQLHTLQSHT